MSVAVWKAVAAVAGVVLFCSAAAGQEVTVAAPAGHHVKVEVKPKRRSFAEMWAARPRLTLVRPQAVQAAPAIPTRPASTVSIPAVGPVAPTVPLMAVPAAPVQPSDVRVKVIQK